MMVDSAELISAGDINFKGDRWHEVVMPMGVKTLKVGDLVALTEQSCKSFFFRLSDCSLHPISANGCGDQYVIVRRKKVTVVGEVISVGG